MRRSLHRMGTPGWIAYLGGLVLFLFIAMMGISLDVWAFAALAFALGLCFALAAPFVFSQRWKPEPPRPTRRPVIRRPH